MQLLSKARQNAAWMLELKCVIWPLPQVAACASDAASSPTGFTRVIVEKPFGKDSESFRQLESELAEHLTEDQMYRIDHYLGKELIENLTVSLNRHINLQLFSWLRIFAILFACKIFLADSSIGAWLVATFCSISSLELPVPH